MDRICTFGLLLVSAAFLSPCALSAATFTGNVDSTWETDGNWDTETVPTSSDDVTIPSGKKVVATTAIVCNNLSLPAN